jgi:hypothetical protein
MKLKIKQIVALGAVLISFDSHASSWKFVIKDSLGEHFINPRKVRYIKPYGEAKFLLLTNEYEEGTQNLNGKSFTTEYEIFCSPSPEIYNRYKFTLYSKEWGKGKKIGSFMAGTPDWRVEEPKEIALVKIVCKGIPK